MKRESGVMHAGANGKMSLLRVPLRLFKIVAGSGTNFSAKKFPNLSGTITADVMFV